MSQQEEQPTEQQQNEKLAQTTQTTFERIASVVQGEMQAGFNELELLRKMNESVALKYEVMTERATTVTEKIREMKEQCMNGNMNFFFVDTCLIFWHEARQEDQVLTGYFFQSWNCCYYSPFV